MTRKGHTCRPSLHEPPLQGPAPRRESQRGRGSQAGHADSVLREEVMEVSGCGFWGGDGGVADHIVASVIS